MPVERARPTFGVPQSLRVNLEAFPDAKIRIPPLSGWVKDKDGTRYAEAGLYNGSINPFSRVIVEEKVWRALQGELPAKSTSTDNSIDHTPLVLPEWAVLKTSRVTFGYNRGGLPVRGLILDEVDLSLSGKLQKPLEF